MESSGAWGMIIGHYNEDTQGFFNGDNRVAFSTNWGFACEGRIPGLARWHDDSRVSLNALLSVDKLKRKCQGRVGELVPRDSFNVIQGCINSGPGRLGIPEVTWTDGLGFSLCAALLESLGPVFQGSMVRTVVGGMEVQSIPDRREVEGLSE